MQTPLPARPHVLVIEDDQELRETICLLLKEEGYQVASAANLNEALALLDVCTFSLIISDLFATTASHVLDSVDPLVVQAHPTPVGIVTGWRIPDSEVELHRLRFILPKPFDLDDLVATVADALDEPLTEEQRAWLPIITTYFERASARDWDDIVTLCTDDVVYSLPGTTRIHEFSGKEAFRAFIERAFAVLPATRFDGLQIYGMKNGLAVRFRSIWQLPDGKSEAQGGAVVFHFANDRISHVGVRINTQRIARWIGRHKHK